MAGPFFLPQTCEPSKFLKVLYLDAAGVRRRTRSNKLEFTKDIFEIWNQGIRIAYIQGLCMTNLVSCIWKMLPIWGKYTFKSRKMMEYKFAFTIFNFLLKFSIIFFLLKLQLCWDKIHICIIYFLKYRLQYLFMYSQNCGTNTTDFKKPDTD